METMKRRKPIFSIPSCNWPAAILFNWQFNPNLVLQQQQKNHQSIPSESPSPRTKKVNPECTWMRRSHLPFTPRGEWLWLTQKLGVDTREIYSSVRGGFWAWSVEIVVFSSPMGYMWRCDLCSFFPSLIWGIFVHRFFANDRLFPWGLWIKLNNWFICNQQSVVSWPELELGRKDPGFLELGAHRFLGQAITTQVRF